MDRHREGEDEGESAGGDLRGEALAARATPACGVALRNLGPGGSLLRVFVSVLVRACVRPRLRFDIDLY